MIVLGAGYAAQQSCSDPKQRTAGTAGFGSDDTVADTEGGTAGASADGSASGASVSDKASGLTQVTMPAGQSGQLLHYTGFDVNFNARHHVPNYVAWELTADHANGNAADRKDSDFAPDDRVAGSAQISDYKGSGYDRGHMAPAADMKWSRRAMDDCHYFTNIVPQSNGLNRGPWQTVESNCRNWAERFGRVIIVCGPVLTDRIPATIGNGVSVPERFFKVVLAPDANPPMGIGFLMSNFDFAGGAQSMAVSIDQVEAVTGYDFFSTLPDDIEADVEAQCSYPAWQRRRKGN